MSEIKREPIFVVEKGTEIDGKVEWRYHLMFTELEHAEYFCSHYKISIKDQEERNTQMRIASGTLIYGPPPNERSSS